MPDRDMMECDGWVAAHLRTRIATGVKIGNARHRIVEVDLKLSALVAIVKDDYTRAEDAKSSLVVLCN